jgi:hypothetical protein
LNSLLWSSLFLDILVKVMNTPGTQHLYQEKGKLEKAEQLGAIFLRNKHNQF